MGQHQGARRPFPKRSEVLDRHRVERAGTYKYTKQRRLPNEAPGKRKSTAPNMLENWRGVFFTDSSGVVL